MGEHLQLIQPSEQHEVVRLHPSLDGELHARHQQQPQGRHHLLERGNKCNNLSTTGTTENRKSAVVVSFHCPSVHYRPRLKGTELTRFLSDRVVQIFPSCQESPHCAHPLRTGRSVPDVFSSHQETPCSCMTELTRCIAKLAVSIRWHCLLPLAFQQRVLAVPFLR